ncbi:hypothetical protein JB92DRAFT_3304170 [Gautieria morchelliformis]|nr:hypothetical protein JB92DRAFT_3304170 [Gautieria morchelliformis]
MAEPPPGQPATRSSSCNRKTPDPQPIIIGDPAGDNVGAGAPTSKAGKGKKRKTSAEKAAEDAAAVSSAEASGFIQMQYQIVALKKLIDSGQAVDPPGAALPLRKGILKVTWGDGDQSQTAGPTPVTPPPRNMSPLPHSTPQIVQDAPVKRTVETVAFEIKGHHNGSLEVETISEHLPVYATSSADVQHGEVSRYVGEQKIRLGRGPKLLGEEPIKTLDQHVAGWIPVTVCEGKLTAALTWEHEGLEPLSQGASMEGKVLNDTLPLAPLQGHGSANTQVGPPMLEQAGMARLPVLHEQPPSDQPMITRVEMGVSNPLQDNIMTKDHMVRENTGQEGGEGEGAYRLTGEPHGQVATIGGSRDNGPGSPLRVLQAQRPEDAQTLGEYLMHCLHLPRVDQVASKDVRTAHVVSRWRVIQHARSGMIKLGEGQWSGHAISERELAALVNLGSSTLSTYNSTMEEAMKLDSLCMFEDPSNDLKLQYAKLGVTAFKEKVARWYKKHLQALHAGDSLAEGESSDSNRDLSSSGERNGKKCEQGKKRWHLVGVKTKSAQKKRKRGDVSSSRLDG